MTSGMERELRVAQRRMLRRIVGVHRRKKTTMTSSSDEESQTEDEEEGDASETGEEDMFEESWEEWMRRATGIAEGHAQRANVRDWVRAQRRAKWSLAGHIARRTDGRWSRKCLDWKPVWGKRKVGRPCKRWAGDIEEFVMNEIYKGPHDTEERQWTKLTEDRALWRAWQLKFCR
jgi:hypothetical protein